MMTMIGMDTTAMMIMFTNIIMVQKASIMKKLERPVGILKTKMMTGMVTTMTMIGMITPMMMTNIN